MGEVSNPTDSDFEQFVSVQYGLRAAFVILRRYIRRYGRNTIEKIIRAWAPAVENNTANYIRVVCTKTGFSPTQLIDYADAQLMVKLVKAMAFVECGVVIDDAIIEESYKMA